MKQRKFDPGDVVSLRLPKDLTEQDLKGLNTLKSKLDRDFNKIITPIFLSAVNDYVTKGQKQLTVPLPNKLTEEQENHYNHPMVQQLIGQIVYQLISNPSKPFQIPNMTQQEEQKPTPEAKLQNSFAARFAKKNLLDFDD
ncbi:hypothetical protein [Ectobacillus funiculus]|uniref:Uncharacterized protein n=1 Tax=Ectobacillus funiculus TaxID=137993 RepID=A0ABV5WF90_9BACI